jgi:hypothetical protein
MISAYALLVQRFFVHLSCYSPAALCFGLGLLYVLRLVGDSFLMFRFSMVGSTKGVMQNRERKVADVKTC